MKINIDKIEKLLHESPYSAKPDSIGAQLTRSVRDLLVEVKRLRELNILLNNKLKSVNDELCGHGFMVNGFHLNGMPEPLDSWFVENDFSSVDLEETP